MSKPIKHRGKWRIRWTDAAGLRRSEVYESHSEAKLRLAQRLSEAQEVKNGLRRVTVDGKTVADLCDHWLEYRAPDKRSGSHDESIIRAHIRPFFGRVHCREISNLHATRFKRDRAHLSDKTVNNVLTLLISMLHEAHDPLHWIPAVPRIRKHKVPVIDRNFRFLRSKHEIRRFLSAAREERLAVVVPLFSTAILTGMRAGELAALEWDDIDFDRRIITIARSYSGPTKNGETRYVPIVDALLPVLRSWRLANPLPVVFPNQRGVMHTPSARVFQEILRRTLNRAGFPNHEVNGKPRGYIRFHDLRHTFASHWMMDGGDIFKLQKILGHQSIEMTMRYAHLAPHAFTADHHRLGGLLLPDQDNVVGLRSAVH